MDFNQDLLSNPGVIAAIVFLALMLFVFVPLMIRRAMRQRKRARNYIPDFLKMTGLKQDANGFSGTYKGFPVVFKMGAGYNTSKIAFEALRGIGGGQADFHGRNIVFQTIHIEMKLPRPVPEIILKERIGVLRTDQYINDMIDGKSFDLPEVKELRGKLKRIRIFTENPAFARSFTDNPDLDRLLKNWHYTDIRISGDKVFFTLDDNMSQATFGSRTTKPDFPAYALEICAEAAKSASAFV